MPQIFPMNWVVFCVALMVGFLLMIIKVFYTNK